MKKLFYKSCVRPNKMKPVCVLYADRFHFNMTYCSEMKTTYGDIIPESVTDGNCNIIPWENIKYWCYMDDIVIILKSELVIEKESGND